jgi:predicted transposase/invertase (TIGR01784 family)
LNTNENVKTYKDATGEVIYNMTNDYLFRAVLQENDKVLRGIICSVLRLGESEIVSISIQNPIEIGKGISDKEFWLDIKVLLNNSQEIGLEMQVVNLGNWTDRSLSYLCRTYDSLYKGQNYNEANPVVHIGFLDFTLFEDYPEFYATYKMMNIKNYHIYSDKLQLGVVNLKRIDLATDEDKAYGLDQWAALFKAKTWEELKALGSENTVYEEAVNTMFRLTADELVQEQCRRREEYNQDMRTMERDKARLAEQEAELAERKAKIDEQKVKLGEQKAELAERKAKIDEQKVKLGEQKAELAERKAKIDEQKAELAERKAKIDEQKAELAEQKAIIADKDTELAKQKAEIERLNKLLAKKE